MRLELSPAELAEKLGISVGTFRNRYANNLQAVNDRLKELGEKLRVVEKRKRGRNTVFILESWAATPVSPSSPESSNEAGSPSPASSFSPVLSERDNEELNQLSAKKRQEAFEKLTVVKYAIQFGVRKAAENFRKTPSTVHRWFKVYATEGVKALVGIKEKEYSEALRQVLTLAEAMFCKPQKITIKEIYKEVKKLANELGIELTYEQLRQHLSEFYARKKYYVERLRSGESKAVRFRPRAGRVPKIAPNYRWEWDHTQMDNVVLWNGKEIRPYLSVIRDTYSSYIVAYLLLPYNPNASTVAQLIIQAIKRYGIPKILRTDWGKDFKAERILAGLEELGIIVSNARPYSGWDKGTVEGGFKTVKMQFCRTVPGYSQQDPKERKDIERIWGKEELLTFEEYEKLFAEYVENYNLDKAEEYRPHERKGVDGDFLYWAFAERKVRTVTNATIRLENEYYYADELEEYEGQKVEVRLDDSNDTYVKVFTLDGKFICDAVAESKRDPEAWREKRKRRERKAKELEKAVKARLELHKLQQERKKEAETKLHYKEFEALLKGEPEPEFPEPEIELEEPAVAGEEEVFVPTDDYELLSYIIEKEGKVPEEIWRAYEKFKSENPLAESLYASEIEEIEKLKKEVRK
jgi:transposase InsO family protein